MHCMLKTERIKNHILDHRRVVDTATNAKISEGDMTIQLQLTLCSNLHGGEGLILKVWERNVADILQNIYFWKEGIINMNMFKIITKYLSFGKHLWQAYLYINLACLSVLVSVCLYPINVKTVEPIGPKFFVEHHVTTGKVYEW